MDFWKTEVPPDKQHPNFRQIASLDRLAPERKVIDKWGEGFLDRDGKFVLEFQTTFNSSFWELYLFACFKELGFAADFSFSSPDFVLSGPTDFVAEAVIASHPHGYAPESESGPKLQMPSANPMEVEKRIVLASIRLSNAIAGKLAKYRDKYSALAHVQRKPFVLCVASFEQPLFFLQNDNALRRVLYGYDRPLYFDTEDGRQVVGNAKRSKVRKHTGAEIELGLFTRKGTEDISAVIFSGTATYGKVRALSESKSEMLRFQAIRYDASGVRPCEVACSKADYKEALLDGLHLCVNPYARVPLDLTPFEGREIAIHQYDPGTEGYAPIAPDGFLIMRNCMEIVPVDDLSKDTSEPSSYPEYESPETKPWQEGELVSMEGQVYIYTDQHMAHYRGWTVLLARDTVDNDWVAQAVKGQYCSIAEYMNANQAAPVEDSGMAVGGYPSKELAFDAIKNVVNEVVDG